MRKRYPKHRRDRAVRIVLDRLDEYSSLTPSREAMKPKLGIGFEPPRWWTLQSHIDSGQCNGATSDNAAE